MKTIQPKTDKFQKLYFRILARSSRKVVLTFKRFPEFMQVLSYRITPFFNEIVEKHNLERGLTLRDFRRIAKAENITLRMVEKIDGSKKIAGQYLISAKNDITTIFLQHNLSYKFRLKVAAHELAHHFLHREHLLDKQWGFDSELTGFEFIAELEADYLAAMLISFEGRK